ncbi:MAG: efflux RND transporter periplasmic adaptor subunit, partial [Halanaerobiales bacterium]|nr:efflux RND transporter periplasmic adaptor subunit [Halanaerobiales bacterium]
MKVNKILVITLTLILCFSIIVGAQEPVKTVKPIKEDITIIEQISGKITPNKVVNLSAEISGTVNTVYVSIGDKVNKGDKLLEFDKSQLLIQKKQSEAVLKAAEANLAQLKNGATIEDIKTAEANYEQAEISLNNAKDSLKLIEEIYENKTSLKQQLINAEMQYKNAQQQLLATEERLNQTTKALKQAKVGVQQAKNNLDQTKIDYQRMEQLYKEEVISENQFEGVNLQLKNAQSAYQNSLLQVENAKSSIESARIAKDQAEISLNSAKQLYELTKETYNNPTQLKQQLQGAKTQVEVAKVNLKIAEINLNRVKKGAGEEQIKAAEANLKQAEAGLEQINLQLSKAIIFSPINAHIAVINTEENEMVGAGSPVIRLVDLNKLNVETSLTPQIRSYVKSGDKVDIIIKNDKKRVIEGKISTISPVINAQNEAYPIKIEIIGETDNLYPGTFVDVEISKQRAHKAITLPINAVIDLETFPYVYLVRDNKAVKINLSVG